MPRTRAIRLDASPDAQDALAEELGVDPKQVRTAIAFVRACSDAAERLDIEPEVAIHGLIGFISNSITFHYQESAHKRLHFEAANELLGYAGGQIDEVSEVDEEEDEDEETSPSVH